MTTARSWVRVGRGWPCRRCGRQLLACRRM